MNLRPFLGTSNRWPASHMHLSPGCCSPISSRLLLSSYGFHFLSLPEGVGYCSSSGSGWGWNQTHTEKYGEGALLRESDYTCMLISHSGREEPTWACSAMVGSGEQPYFVDLVELVQFLGQVATRAL